MENKLAETLAIRGSRFNPGRIFKSILRRIPVLGSSNVLFVSKNAYVVDFLEEGVKHFKVPRISSFSHSATLWDQREALLRALIAASIKAGIIDRSRNVIDVGAASGDATFPWAMLIDGVVYAIDPSPKNVAFIVRAAQLNGVANVRPTVAALGERSSTIYPISNIGHTAFSSEPLNSFGKRNPVKCVTIDHLLDVGEIEDIGFLHLDVEGMELAALKGGFKMLVTCRPVIVFEAHLTIDDVNALLDLLRHLEYQCFLVNEVTPGGRPDCVNFYAVPLPGLTPDMLRDLQSVRPVQPFYKATVGENLRAV